MGELERRVFVRTQQSYYSQRDDDVGSSHSEWAASSQANLRSLLAILNGNGATIGLPESTTPLSTGARLRIRTTASAVGVKLRVALEALASEMANAELTTSASPL